MLLFRCPNLRTLSIDGAAPEITGAQRLFGGHWPCLRSLTVGDVAVEFPVATPSDPIIDFLADHSAIKALNISRHILPSIHLGTMPDDALPNLTEFCGSLEQLQALTSYGNIKSVVFREAMLVRDVTPFALSSVLQHLPSLTTLRLAFVLQSPYESGTLLRYLVASCPKLVSFDLTCGNKPSFGLVSDTIRSDNDKLMNRSRNHSSNPFSSSPNSDLSLSALSNIPEIHHSHLAANKLHEPTRD